MAQIDLQNCTLYVYDGKGLDSTGVVVINFTAAEADMTFQVKEMFGPSHPVKIVFVDPAAASQSLSVSVSELTITVNLATDSSSAITTTAALAKAAIEALPAAHALVTVGYDTGEDGTGLLNAKASTTIGMPNYVELKIGEGDFSWSEKRGVEFTLDRGTLDEVKNADQEPMEVSFDFTWEWMRSATGASTPTVYEALTRTGLAAAWLNAATDACRPNCVNLEIKNAPSCGATQGEVTEFREVYIEELNPSANDGAVSASGRSNTLKPTSARFTIA